MRKRRLTLTCALIGLALAAGPPSLAQPAAPPAAVAPAEALAPFAPLVGRTWRGQGTGEARVEDVQRFDWAVGGHAVRITHAVNGGVYGGETLVFPDRDSGRLIFHYFTTGGFHTTGVIQPLGPGAFEIEETVHGPADVRALRSTARLGEDGVYRVRTLVLRDGAWVEAGGFDYREDSSARVELPAVAAPAG